MNKVVMNTIFVDYCIAVTVVILIAMKLYHCQTGKSCQSYWSQAILMWGYFSQRDTPADHIYGISM